MKIAKPHSVSIQRTSQGIIDNYLLVSDIYDFGGNACDDVTTASLLDVFNAAGKMDYGLFRDSLATSIVPNWNSISMDEKLRCVSHYKYPSNISNDEWNSYFTPKQHEQNWNRTVTYSRDKMRLPRMFAAFQRISYELNQMQVAVIYMTTKNYCIDYYYANLPHLLLWITNGAYPALGVDFTNSGFAQQSGYSDSLRDKLVDIINNGNYVGDAE